MKNAHHPDESRINELASHVCDYLRGYAQMDPSNLHHLMGYRSWAVLAKNELDARASSFVRILGNEELQAIASGHLSLADLARQVSAEIKEASQ